MWGHVGTGFDQTALKSLYATMKSLRTDQKPFDQKVKYANATTWLMPKLVAEVKFTEWTSEAKCGIPPSLACAATKTRSTLSENKHDWPRKAEDGLTQGHWGCDNAIALGLRFSPTYSARGLNTLEANHTHSTLLGSSRQQFSELSFSLWKGMSVGCFSGYSAGAIAENARCLSL